MIPIRYVIGDATRPLGLGRRIIAHVCNTDGKWGAGFVLALNKVSLEPMNVYRRWAGSKGSQLPADFIYREAPFELGQIRIASFEPADVFVANMLGQTLADGPDGIPLSYSALYACLERLRLTAQTAGASIHMPRIGCGLAGGSWVSVEDMILRRVSSFNVPVTVYDLPVPPKLTLD